jgi:hypothetical protein
MLTPILKTEQYPTRYVAFDNPAVLIEHSNPERRGGFEFAVYHSDNLYIEICAYQDDKGFLMDVSVHNGCGWNRVYCQRHGSYVSCLEHVDSFVFPPLVSYD